MSKVVVREKPGVSLIHVDMLTLRVEELRSSKGFKKRGYAKCE